MPKLELDELLTDPDFCQSFTITRHNGSNVNGRFVSTPSTFQVTGIIRPANTQDIKMMPEGDSVEGVVIVYTKEELYVTRAGNQPGLSDEVTWQGEQYKIFQTSAYGDFGHFKSMAIRKLGA